MVMLRDGRRDARTSYSEEQLEAQEAPSHHGQLSHLHHSPGNTQTGSSGGEERGLVEGDMPHTMVEFEFTYKYIYSGNY